VTTDARPVIGKIGEKKKCNIKQTNRKKKNRTEILPIDKT
jgi:hypothetical protein